MMNWPWSTLSVDPVETHVHGLGTLGLHRTIAETNCTLVVRGANSSLLWEAEIGERLARLLSLLAGFKNSCLFGFTGGAGDNVRTTRNNIDKTIGWGFVLTTLCSRVL